MGTVRWGVILRVTKSSTLDLWQEMWFQMWPSLWKQVTLHPHPPFRYTQKEQELQFGTFSLCISVGTGTPAGKSEEHFWPLTAPEAPLQPHIHLRASDMGLYWLVWDRPPQVSLLILAALPSSQEDNLLWLPFISHLLALFSSLSFSLFCRFPLHFALLLHDLPPPPSAKPIRLLVCFLSFSLQLLSFFFSSVWE